MNPPAQPTQPRATRAAGRMEADPERERADAGRPCWAFVAALFIAPLALIEYVVDWYYRFHTCTLGAICNDDFQISAAAILIPWLLFAALWIILWLAHSKVPMRPSVIWRLGQVRSLRELLTIFAGLTLIGFIWALLGGRVSLEIGMVTPIVIAATIHSYFWKAPEVDREALNDQAPPPGV
ncbi:MAG TPA: hypothetical protein VKQ36_03765 [Ktedonobacterales bacterium]|nr:hypothetical protein [Ktedonobacterales bacterium]